VCVCVCVLKRPNHLDRRTIQCRAKNDMDRAAKCVALGLCSGSVTAMSVLATIAAVVCVNLIEPFEFGLHGRFT
jgi:hypothetical protein